MNIIKFGAVGVELLYSAISGSPVYERRDFWTNIRMYTGFLAVTQVWMIPLLFLYRHVSEKSLFHLEPEIWWTWAILVIADDFTFYWYHRTQHRVRLFWGTHIGHHDSEQFNYSVGLRQPWFQPFALLYWLPLAYIGFDPIAIIAVNGANFAFQELLHTRHVGRLGIFEWVFNTPSHHRVHHGSNPQYIDKNFGGILIIWDRIFGTFAHEAETVRFGLPEKNLAQPHSAVESSFSYLWKTIQDGVRQKTPDEAWSALFGAPERRAESTDSLARSG